MEKLMIGQIQTRYNLFLNNTTNIKNILLIQAIRDEFQNHFGAADDYLEERIREHKKMKNGENYHNLERKCKYFKIKDYKAGCVHLMQDQDKPKHRGMFVELIRFNNRRKQMNIVPFIKFHCNPQGILILEKIWFESIV